MALDLHKAGKKLNDSNVKNYVESEIVGKGRVVPGFGHAVLRSTDPRFVLQREFALQKIQNDELTEYVFGVSQAKSLSTLLVFKMISSCVRFQSIRNLFKYCSKHFDGHWKSQQSLSKC